MTAGEKDDGKKKADPSHAAVRDDIGEEGYS
jgi:hypothetical protein